MTTENVRSASRIAALSLMSLLVACAEDADNSPGSVGEAVSYTPLPSCPFELEGGLEAECGTLNVPEDYNQPDGRRIELAVAIFASTSETPRADPLVYLTGGPGGGAVSAVAAAAPALAPLLAERAFIALDQRGTGLSKPALTCPEVDALTDQGDVEAAVLGCRDRWEAEGVVLSQYDTHNNARDVAALRRVLGFKQWNAIGTSYGTRLALELMRDDGAGLRSVVLDSTLAPDLDALGQTASAAQRAFQQVFDACAGDPACAEASPGLGERFFALVDQLDEAPLADKRADGTAVTINGTRFVQLMGMLLYDVQGITVLPQIVAEAESGATTTIDALQLLDALAAGDGLATGMNLSVVCAEYAPFTSAEAAGALAQGVPPEISLTFNPARYLAACPLWGVPAAPKSEAEPVHSDIPTLVLAGAFDPSTPPAWGQHVASTLSHAEYRLFQAATHGVMRTECGMLTAANFLHDPSKLELPQCVQADSSALWSAAKAAQP